MIHLVPGQGRQASRPLFLFRESSDGRLDISFCIFGGFVANFLRLIASAFVLLASPAFAGMCPAGQGYYDYSIGNSVSYPSIKKAFESRFPAVGSGVTMGTTTWVNNGGSGNYIAVVYAAQHSSSCPGGYSAAPCDLGSPEYIIPVPDIHTATLPEVDCTVPPTSPTASQCLAKPAIFSAIQVANKSLSCVGGCVYEAVNDGSGGEVGLGAYNAGGVGHTCALSANAWTCPTGFTAVAPGGWDSNLSQTCLPDAGDSDHDGILNGTDANPFVPGDTPDSDADGIPDNLDAAPNDPTNGKTAEDGTVSKNTSVGGGSCSQPPVSKGDGIAAQIAYQTWATRCAVLALKSATASASSSSSGLTSSQAADLAAVKASTATTASNTGAAAAAAALINGKLGTDTSGDLDSRGSDGQPGDGAAAGFGEELTFGTDGLNTDGYGAPRSCPSPPTFNFQNRQYTIDTAKFCEWMHLTSVLVLLLASFASLRIIASGSQG